MDAFVEQLANYAGRMEHETRGRCRLSAGRTLGERLVLEGTNWVNLRFFTPISLAFQMAAPSLVESGSNPCPDETGPVLAMRLLLDLPPSTPSTFVLWLTSPKCPRLFGFL